MRALLRITPTAGLHPRTDPFSLVAVSGSLRVTIQPDLISLLDALLKAWVLFSLGWEHPLALPNSEVNLPEVNLLDGPKVWGATPFLPILWSKKTSGASENQMVFPNF